GAATLTANPRIYDGDSHHLTLDVANIAGDATIVLGSETNNLTIANGTATIDVAAAADLNLDVDLTVDGQKTTITGADQANTITLNESFTLGGGNSGTLTFSGSTKTLTVEDDAIINQDVTSDAAVTLASLDTGFGANELYDMDQHVLEASGVTFATLTLTDALDLSDGAIIDQSGNGLVEITEGGDSLQFVFGATDLGIVWSDGVLNLRNAEDSDAIVEIEGKDAGEKGILRVLSDGDDKYITAYHDDTDSWLASSSGDLTLAPDGDVDDFVAISTTSDVTSISVPGSTGTLGTTAAEWDALYLNASGVIYGENDQGNTLTSGAAGWTANLNFDVTGDTTITGTLTADTIAQSAVATPSWLAQDSSTTAAAEFIIGVDAVTAEYGATMVLKVDEGDGADGDEDQIFMTLNGVGVSSTNSGTIELERLSNFEMGL
ncbi:unnamed protein product, partial [marine sediment metagenome]